MKQSRSIRMVFRILVLIISMSAVSWGTDDMPTGEMSWKNPHVKSVAAIAEVIGNGQIITAAVIEYDKKIANSMLSPSTFFVEGRTVTAVYANSEAARAPRGVDGRYAVIELSPSDEGARSFLQNGPTFTRTEIKVAVAQVVDIITVDGDKYAPNAAVMTNDRTIEPVVDDFAQFEFEDARTGETLKYNLFVPKHYDAKKSYPMVMFIPDAAATSDETDTALVQGLGAVIWATPPEQAKHECFVLAPQFTTRGTDSAQRHDTIVHLIEDVAGRYSIDKNRLYTTGQSMGCMLSIAVAIKHPDLFAASLLVAGQWDADAMSVLADKKMWIIVSEGDTRAFPGMNASLAVMEPAGAKISRAVWDARAEEAETAANVEKMAAEDTNIKYTVFEKGTTLSEDEANSGRNEHMQTWWFAYGIEGVRDWLFAQKKSN
jgi:predicted peptidase